MDRRHAFSNINGILIFTFLFYFSSSVIAQDSSKLKEIEINVETGLSYQYFGLENFLLTPKEPRIINGFLSAGRVNAIGFGLPVGVSFYSPRMRLGLKV